jgi:hypothetical protein
MTGWARTAPARPEILSQPFPDTTGSPQEFHVSSYSTTTFSSDSEKMPRARPVESSR